MKKIFMTAAVMAFLASSCQNDEIVKQSANEGNVFTLEVNRGMGSRTEMGENNATVWSEGDKLYVTSEDGAVTGVLTLVGEGGSAEGKFQGYIFGGEASELDNLVFPVPNMEGETMTINMGSRDAKKLDSPIIGKLENGAVKGDLTNVGGLIAVNLVGMEGNSVKVSAENDSDCLLGGTYTYNPEDGTLSYEAPASTKELTLIVPEDGVLYVPVAVSGTTEQDVNLKLTVGENTITEEIKVKSGDLKESKDYAYDEEIGFADFTEVANLEELVKAFQAEGTDKYIKLTDDIVVEESEETEFAGLNVKNGMILDLNGKTLSADLDIDEDGKCNGVDGLITVLRPGKLIVTGEGTINGSGLLAAIKLTKKDDEGSSQKAELIIENGNITNTTYVIAGNGNEGRGNVNVTINGGTLTSTEGTAIFQSYENGLLTINNGTITGVDAAVEIRDSEMIVKNGTLTATATEWSVTTPTNGNGTNNSGAAVSIAPHNKSWKGCVIKVTIENGTLTGAFAIAGADVEGESESDKTSIEIKGGTFNGTWSGSKYAVNFLNLHSWDNEGIISGGTFNKQVKSIWVVEGKKAVKQEDGSYVIENAPVEETEGTKE